MTDNAVIEVPADEDAAPAFVIPAGPYQVRTVEGDEPVHLTGSIAIAVAQLALPGVNDSGEARYTDKRYVEDAAGNRIDTGELLIALGIRNR